jgi:hypothetical protein
MDERAGLEPVDQGLVGYLCAECGGKDEEAEERREVSGGVAS